MQIVREPDFEGYLQPALKRGHNRVCLWVLRPGEIAPPGTVTTPVGGVGLPLHIAFKYEGDDDGALGVQDEGHVQVD